MARMMAATGRTTNGKSKPLKGSSQDYTNLLFSDSESDEKVPDLRLPPLKGKRQKRKRNMGFRPEDTSCGIGNVFKVLLTITIVAGILALAAISFWSLKKITEMEDQIEKLQKSDAATPETITSLQKNIATHDNSISDLSSSSKEIKTRLEGIDKKIEGFESTKTALDQKFNEAKEILDLPAKLMILKKTVVEMESNVHQATATISDLKEQINDLKDKLSAPAPTPSEEEREKSDVDKQVTSMVLEKINAVNQTLARDLSALKQQVENQEMVMTAFTVAHSSDSDVSSDALNKVISDTVTKIMENKSAPVESQSYNQTKFEAVVENVQELLEMKSEFVLLKAEMMSDFQSVNTTLSNFSAEFGEINTHLTLIDNIVTNFSNLISLKSSNEEEGTVPDQTTGHPEVPSAQNNTVKATSPSPATGANSTPGEIPVNEGGNDANTLEETEGEGSNDEELRKALGDIKSLAALNGFFTETLKSNNGTVKISDFADMLHLDSVDFTVYDTNEDGYLSEEELADVLGLRPSRVKRRKRSEW